MEIIDFEFPFNQKFDDKIVLCLGFFDGVHIGHQKLIEKAKSYGFKVGILTFDNSPKIVLGQKKLNNYICSNADKAEYFEELDIDYFFLMHFDKEVARLTKDEFIDGFIKKIDPIKILIGEEYTFGARGEGNPRYLKNYFDVDIVDFYKINGNKVSSRTICDDIEKGKIEEANSLLGRPYRISGLVVEGNKMGHSIEFPTANLELDFPYVFPGYGVYMGYAYVNDKKFKSLIIVGMHKNYLQIPLPVIEVHLLNFVGNLYYKDINIEFISRLRDKKDFLSSDLLIEQIEKDLLFVEKNLK